MALKFENPAFFIIIGPFGKGKKNRFYVWRKILVKSVRELTRIFIALKSGRELLMNILRKSDLVKVPLFLMISKSLKIPYSS